MSLSKYLSTPIKSSELRIHLYGKKNRQFSMPVEDLIEIIIKALRVELKGDHLDAFKEDIIEHFEGKKR